MRIKTIAVAILLASVLFTSCKKEEDETIKKKTGSDVSFDASYAADIFLDIPAANREINANESFNFSSDIELISSNLVKVYRDNIKKVNTGLMTYTISNVSVTPMNFESLKLEIYDEQDNKLFSEDLPNSITSGTYIKYFDGSAAAITASTLKNSDTLRVTLSGVSITAPAQFSSTLEFDAEIIADPI